MSATTVEPLNLKPAFKLSIAELFNHYAVIQQNMEAPVWGTAVPGETVTVKFRGQAVSATANNDGKWMLRLKAMKAEPDQKASDLTLEGKDKTIVLTNIMVGEVWVGSGQSNMALPINFFIKDDAMLAAMVKNGPYPNLRMFCAYHGGHQPGSWQAATSEGIFCQNASGMLFPFGVFLHKELNVPVGLLCAAVNGSPSARWLSEDAFKTDEACQALINKQLPAHLASLKLYDSDLEKWETAAAIAKQSGTAVPKKPSAPAHPGSCRKGSIGEHYEGYIRKMIPYAVRGVLWDQGESGTAIPAVDQYTLMGALIRGWRRDWGQGDFPFLYVQKPSGGGCCWDPTNPVTIMAEAFTPWSKNLKYINRESPALEGLERFINIMKYPKTVMVISSDLGGGIHPVNKYGYARRACDVALGAVYDRSIEYLGPIYDSHVTEGSVMRILYKHVGKGLAFKHGTEIQGFVVAGEDRVFHWATAKINGEAVEVQNENVLKPIAVRYAWSVDRTGANLFNKDGLPAVPFRTDTW